MAASASRSPSPPTSPPIPLAPGPRATALQKLYTDAITHVIHKGCSYPNFSSCFPTPAQHVLGSLKLLHEQFTEKLGESMQREFASILETREVVQGLNGLDGLIGEARRRKGRSGSGEGGEVQRAPHTLPAQSLYLAHLMPTLTQYSNDMQSRQNSLQSENIELLDRVMQQRREISSLVTGLEKVVQDLDASVASLQEGQMEGLRDEVRDVDEDMR